MSWEQRGNGRYYYRKQRSGGQVVSEYMGGGDLGATLAQLDALEREQRTLERAELRAERAAVATLDQELDDLASMIRTLMQAVLLINGYHQHKRQWRRSRERPTEP